MTEVQSKCTLIDVSAIVSISSEARVAGTEEATKGIGTEGVGVTVEGASQTFVDIIAIQSIHIELKSCATAACEAANLIGTSLITPSILCCTFIDINAPDSDILRVVARGETQPSKALAL
jgi:hypothetical protein